MKLLALVVWKKRSACRLRAPKPARQAAAEHETTALPDDEPRPRGCGWFDSSIELRQGLLVTEYADVDEASPVLPLDAWLAAKLANWRPSIGELQR